MKPISELISLVSKSAPLLGAALAGPFGGTVGALIAAEFGGKSSVPEELLNLVGKDAESDAKLKQIEASNQQDLFKLTIQEYSMELEDRKDARNMSEKNEWQTFALAISYLTFFVVTCMLEMLGYANVNSELQGTLTGIAFMIGAFYFGRPVNDRVSISKKK